ncbi:TIGR03943 family putative permease subunit [Lacrimispora sp. AGF001]|jgi:putative membrane protein|uniref:TIGR03943 family putative permease subunit n=1 Tax=Lacrimispora sp. AGF001 TaxID=3401631 RepID=UPI003B432622|nr:TIGR03943 family protein [Paenibacillaceae bacterium]
MKLRGKGLNIQALTESVCYLVFGILLFRLTVTGAYLSYVTPRMKPYLYGLSAVMILWAGMGAFRVFRPKYKARLFHCLVLGIPILVLAVPPAPPAGSAAIKNYSSSSIPGSSAQGAGDDYGNTGEQATNGFDYYEDETAAEEPDDSAGYGENAGEEQTQSQQPELLKGAELNGLDEKARTITIADDDYYAWMTELGEHADQYQGYTVTMKGFVFLDLENRQENEFALVRLSMWCCSADMAPMGLMAYDTGGLKFQENDWVTVTGKLLVKDGYPTIDADNMVVAEKPQQEYVYPYY